MKKINSKKGFTLVEITIVIAIIVILSAAALGGLASIDRANQNADQVRLHAAGGHFWRIENGQVVELEPGEFDPDDPTVKSGGAMDLEYDRVKYIGGSVDYNPPTTYTPGGGSGGTTTPGGDTPGDNPGGGSDNPGGGGSGGSDNPGGGGAANPVNPNEHTQSYNDTLKEFLDYYGVHYDITDNGDLVWTNPDGGYNGMTYSEAWKKWQEEHSGSTSSSSGTTANGMSFNTGAGAGTRGVIDYETNGNSTTFNVTDLQGQQNLEMTITKVGDDYVLDMGSAKWNINYQFPGYDYSTNASVYTLNDAQKEWLTNTYGINFT